MDSTWLSLVENLGLLVVSLVAWMNFATGAR